MKHPRAMTPAALALIWLLAGCSGDGSLGGVSADEIDSGTTALPDLGDQDPETGIPGALDGDANGGQEGETGEGGTAEGDAPDGGGASEDDTTDGGGSLVPDGSGVPETGGTECEEGEGCFLDPCSSNDDCLSGYCVEHMGNDVCTKACDSECPPGWSCTPVTGAGADVTFLCVSDATYLCRPCITHADCAGALGVEDACLDYGPGGNFCGAACEGDQDCPEGFLCADTPVITGAKSMQCVYSDGLCPCSDKAINLGLETACEIVNDDGVCGGKRACEPGGLGVCDAEVPAPDVCNGEDDDCDGETDEDGCDDGNPCTTDYCEPDLAEPCVHTPKDGVPCDDGSACTLTDFCMEGECKGNPKWCNDDNTCTDDACDAETGECVFSSNDGDCDDGDPCTEGDLCIDGACVATPLNCQCTDDGDCAGSEDGDVCNGTLVCDTSTLPYSCVLDPETIATCPAPEGKDAPCQITTCDPTSGECGFEATNDGVECDDGDACTLGDSCSGGVCASETPLDCTDDSTCTSDSCDPLVGCINQAFESSCDDQNPCTVGDACSDGVCVSGQEVDCDDNNECTDDGCHPIDGCQNLPKFGNCDDGNLCSTGDTCIDGECVADGELVCDDGNYCTDQSCNPDTGCVTVFNQSPCDDSNACTTGDLCSLGTCTGGGALPCDDGNACTENICDPASGCTVTYLSIGCDDLNPCTSASQCSGGTCIGTAIQECADGNPCTDDLCGEDGCYHLPNDDLCDDENACTLGDRCEAQVCLPGHQLSCADGNVCTDDGCEPESGCTFIPNEGACSDEDACTDVDVCFDGLCLVGDELDCDDQIPCTEDSCDPIDGCVHQLKNGLCNDLNPCTLDICAEDGCHNLNTGNACDDQNPCTVNDSCQVFTGQCMGYGAPVTLCNDDNPCTTDMCDIEQGCVHLFHENPCNDGNSCNGTDSDQCFLGECINTELSYDYCDDNNPCTTDSCTPGGGCDHENNNSPCNDNNPCTVGDTCAGGECSSVDFGDCEDGSLCTTDTCEPGVGCIHEYNTVDCNDGDPCTTGDACFNGTCGAELLNCDDGNVCTQDSCVEGQGCLHSPVPSCCGNGTVEIGETCDDSNTIDGDGCDKTCHAETCPDGSAHVNGLCWVHAQNWDPVEVAHEATCAAIGKQKTSTVIQMDWNADIVAQISTALGYTSAGDYSDSAHGLWCDNASGQCGTHNYGSFFENYGPYPNNWWWGNGNCCPNGAYNCGYWWWWGNNYNCNNPDHNWRPVYTCYP